MLDKLQPRSIKKTSRAKYTASLFVRLTPDRKRRLDQYDAAMKTQGITMTYIVEWALSAVLDEESYGLLILRKLDRDHAESERFWRGLRILSETRFLFIQQDLAMSTPASSTERRPETIRKAVARNQRFLKSLEANVRREATSTELTEAKSRTSLPKNQQNTWDEPAMRVATSQAATSPDLTWPSVFHEPSHAEHGVVGDSHGSKFKENA